MTIRDAVPADLDDIAALIHELAVYEKAPDEAVFTLEDLHENVFGPKPVAEVLIAERDGGEVAGMALYFRSYSTWVGRSGIWLEDLFVRPRVPGRGPRPGAARRGAGPHRRSGRVGGAGLERVGDRVLPLARRRAGRRVDPVPVATRGLRFLS